MRDIDRIKPFLAELGEIWKKHPDLRFGQLMFNVFADFGDPFFLEEDEFLVALKAHLNGKNPRKAVHQYWEEQKNDCHGRNR